MGKDILSESLATKYDDLLEKIISNELLVFHRITSDEIDLGKTLARKGLVLYHSDMGAFEILAEGKDFFENGGFERQRNKEIIKSRNDQKLRESTLKLQSIQSKYFYLKAFGIVYLVVDFVFVLCNNKGIIGSLYALK